MSGIVSFHVSIDGLFWAAGSRLPSLPSSPPLPSPEERSASLPVHSSWAVYKYCKTYETALSISYVRAKKRGPGGSVHGERANFTGLVLGCVEADFCNQMLI